MPRTLNTNGPSEKSAKKSYCNRKEILRECVTISSHDPTFLQRKSKMRSWASLLSTSLNDQGGNIHHPEVGRIKSLIYHWKTEINAHDTSGIKSLYELPTPCSIQCTNFHEIVRFGRKTCAQNNFSARWTHFVNVTKTGSLVT